MVTGRGVSFKKRTETVVGKAGGVGKIQRCMYVQDWVSGESRISIEYIEYPAYTDTNSPARFKSRQVRDVQPWHRRKTRCKWAKGVVALL